MENKNLEYKLKYSKHILNSICAFLNSDGGRILIGFSDSGGFVGIKNPNIINDRIAKDIESFFRNFADKISTQINSRNNQSYIEINVEKSNEEQGYAYVIDKDRNKDFYFRIGEKNIKTDEEHAPYWETVSLYDLPVFKEYAPSENKKKMPYKKLLSDKNVSFEQIGNLPYGNFFYKYMDLESALLCLSRDVRTSKEPNLRFVEPSFWDDQYEGRFYNAKYDGKENDPVNTPFLYACCFSAKRENEAAWILYSHNKKGLASRCVEFSLNRTKLRDELSKNIENGTSLYIGTVKYTRKEIIDNLHLPYIGKDNRENVNYHKYFDNFSLQCYLNLLLLKRPTFEHEKEVRIFIIPKMGKQKSRRNNNGDLDKRADPIFINIDWINVIEEIKIDKNCSDYEKKLLQEKIYRLLEDKKNDITRDEYQRLQQKLAIKEFDPYKDESLMSGQLSIKTGVKK